MQTEEIDAQIRPLLSRQCESLVQPRPYERLLASI